MFLFPLARVCATRWTSLRDKFTKEKKKMDVLNRNESSSFISTTWEHYDSMVFLKDYIKHRMCVCLFNIKALHYERGKDYSLFFLLIFLLCLALASILSAERSIKETKNALFHARSGNGPLDYVLKKYVNKYKVDLCLYLSYQTSFN